MRHFRISIALMFLAGPYAMTGAREAEILDYTRSAEPSEAPLETAPGPAATDGLIRPRMPAWNSPSLSHAGQTVSSSMGHAMALTEAHWAAGYAAPAHWAIAQRDCEHVTYAPTWWNPPETERRRALHFNAVGQVACEYGLPHRLLDALIAQESGFNPHAISRAGAAGIMQIMPETARSLGLSSPFDPLANLRAGARYLRQQLDRFGRFDLALAAYNAGPERRSLQMGLIPAIPETRHYVHTIITNWGRLIKLEHRPAELGAKRGELAARAAQSAGYRSIEFIRFDGTSQAQ